MKRPEYQQNQFYVWTRIPIRFRDLDPLNHVNNAIYSTYFEEARLHFTEQVPALKEAVEAGQGFVATRLSINFIHPAEYPGNLWIGTAIKEYGAVKLTSFQAAYRENDKKLCAVAETTGAWVNINSGKPVRLPSLTDEVQEKVKGKFDF